MNTANETPQAQQWHKAPDDVPTCSVCGLARKFYRVKYQNKSHRAWREGDPPGVRWLVKARMNSVRTIKTQGHQFAEELVTPEERRERIRQAAARILLGIPRKAIAQALGVRTGSLNKLVRTNPAALERALVEVRGRVPPASCSRSKSGPAFRPPSASSSTRPRPSLPPA